MTTKVNINTKTLIDAVRSVFNNVKKDKSTQQQIAEFIVNRIVALARTSKTAASGERKSLPKLSKSYRDYRKTKSALQKASSPFFNPTSSKSNLSFTGQLLNSITFEIKQDKIIIFFKNSSRSDSKETNAKIYEYLLEKDIGYNILGLDEAGRERVRRIVVDLLRKEIKSRFK
jgi:hypothetical protein